jgi:predicted DCC family thiol-disulfide oxidoreductase YuxK
MSADATPASPGAAPDAAADAGGGASAAAVASPEVKIDLPLLVFDGDCAFCTSSVQFGQRWIERMPTAVPWQFTDLARLGLTEQQCVTAVQYVARDHHVYSGEDAVAAVLLGAGRGWWFLGAIMRAPGIHWLSGVAYRWVAKNRHRLPGGTAACAIDPSRRT